MFPYVEGDAALIEPWSSGLGQPFLAGKLQVGTYFFLSPVNPLSQLISHVTKLRTIRATHTYSIFRRGGAFQDANFQPATMSWPKRKGLRPKAAESVRRAISRYQANNVGEIIICSRMRDTYLRCTPTPYRTSNKRVSFTR